MDSISELAVPKRPDFLLLGAHPARGAAIRCAAIVTKWPSSDAGNALSVVSKGSDGEEPKTMSYASILSQNAAISGWGRSGIEAVCGTYNVARKNG